jgi:hypothetical protein
MLKKKKIELHMFKKKSLKKKNRITYAQKKNR